MGKYTAWDDPLPDQVVECHMQKIVGAVRSRFEPQALVLRGSFSQGEGSVVVDGSTLHFLSDYELIAISPHYGHRRWLQAVAQEMTAELGVETSISRVHPANIEHNSLGNVPIRGLARPTIAMYEIQTCGRTLYGEQCLNRGPAIDPAELDPWVGLRLLMNRMAESLERLPRADKSWDELRWINKTVLSCSDALLIVYKRYHYSYAERGRRFAELAPELRSVIARAPHLPELVARSTAFKLRPCRDLYPEPVPVLWQQVRTACDAALRHVAERYLGLHFDSYADFPALYLDALIRGKSRRALASDHLMQNVLLSLRSLRTRRRFSPALLTHLTYPAYQVVYSVVPLIFQSGDDVLPVARRWLSQIGSLQPRSSDRKAEWSYLRARTAQAWKELCYGMWDALAV